jgi:hypothetical protein
MKFQVTLRCCDDLKILEIQRRPDAFEFSESLEAGALTGCASSANSVGFRKFVRPSRADEFQPDLGRHPIL